MRWVYGTIIWWALLSSAQAQDGEPTVPMAESTAAAETSAFDATFSLTLTSDYIFRGISQTDSRPAVQPFVEAEYGMFYVNGFLSNVDFNAPEPDVETDIGFGVRPEWADISFDFGGVAYLYHDDPAGLDYVEGTVAASYTFQDRLTVTGKTFVSPDFLGLDAAAAYVEGSASLALPLDLAVSAALGGQSVEGDVLADYATWNVGLSYELLDAVTFDVRYHDTSLGGTDCTAYAGVGDACDERVVGSVKLALPLSRLTSR